MTNSNNQFSNANVVCLAGGVGGAKMTQGLAQIVAAERLTIIGNTGDDFQHLGLTICPDLDTLMYTLAGVANSQTGWGRADESWRTIEEVKRLGGPDWFNLGDLDLATHLTRSHLLAEGKTLTQATQHLCQQFRVGPTLLPMSNQPTPTLLEVETAEESTEILPFQIWFVQKRWQPVVRKIHLSEKAQTTPQVRHALEQADVVIIAPSNPFVSINPILNAYPVRALLQDMPKAVVAVSPIIAGAAVKGPAAKLMQELNLSASASGVAAFYEELIDGFVYDVQDEGTVANSEMGLLCIDTLMKTEADRRRVAQQTLGFALELAAEAG